MFKCDACTEAVDDKTDLWIQQKKYPNGNMSIIHSFTVHYLTFLWIAQVGDIEMAVLRHGNIITTVFTDYREITYFKGLTYFYIDCSNTHIVKN